MDKKITIAGSDVIDSYEGEIAYILSMLQSPEALVTDESHLGDFFIFELDDEDKQILDAFYDDLGIDPLPMSISFPELAKLVREIKFKKPPSIH